MPVLSDVGVALKRNLFDNLDEDSKSFLNEKVDIILYKSEIGILFYFRNFNIWDRVNNERIDHLYDDLLNNNPSGSDYKIVEVCFDYPDSHNDAGRWENNPWNLHRKRIVKLCFDER